ncbi:MAG TPA: MBL fold metallo-hydrolase [Candidatus Limnocylindrales bacterium]
MRIGDGIHRIGTAAMINSYLIEEAGAVTIVDAGLPGYWRDLPGELAAMGRSLEDVRAVVLTHGHSDHIGFAERIRRERGVPIRILDLDAALARGEVGNPARGRGPMRIAPLLRFIWFGLRHGMNGGAVIAEVSTFGDGATLDVPGAPRVIALPGHTPGSAALHVASRDALFIGDAIATYSVTTGARGPMIAPFGADAETALASLTRLDGVQADLVLPGHGEAWTGGVAEAVRIVRAGAATAEG